MRRKSVGVACVILAAGIVCAVRWYPTAPSPVPRGISACDESLWRHVWYPPRLQVVRPCITVEGTVMARDASEDGDLFLEVNVGEPFTREYPDLLNDKNRERQHGNLVVELVCRRPVTQKSAAGACDGYVPRDPEPAKGDYVRVHGPLVLDTSHGWMEIHPAETQILRRADRARRRGH